MRFTQVLVLSAVAALAPAMPSIASAQVSIQIGAAPVCSYGYFDYAPYNCAPYGYYGPQWFHGSTFIGAGPWFHGPANFHGNVNNRFDPQHGYRGPLPGRGGPPPRGPRYDPHFNGNEFRNGRGPGGPGGPGPHGGPGGPGNHGPR